MCTWHADMSSTLEHLEFLKERSEGEPPGDKSPLQSSSGPSMFPMCSRTSEHLCASGCVRISKPDFCPELHKSAYWVPPPGYLPSSSNSAQINLDSLSVHHKFCFHSWTPIPMNDISIYPIACKRNMRISPASTSPVAIYV